MQQFRILTMLSAVAFSLVTTHAASSIVYSNATSYTGSILNPGLNEVGDEIILGPGPRYAESFRFEYYGNGFSGDEGFRLRFYANDGTFIGNNTYLPNSVLYDSGVLPLADPSGRSSYEFNLTFDILNPLPDDFTWSILFSGITGGETAGLSIYNPPTVGLSENDYWFNNGTTWELRGTNGIAFNFGASLVTSTVPEPSTYALAIIGGLCGLALVNRRRRKH